MRLDGIDVLRGTAVIFVVIYHFFVLLGLNSNPMFHYIHSFGLFGVSLFFIISGYLIYRSIDYSISTHGMKRGLKKYTLHRLFRILPAYYFNFLIVLIMATSFIGASYLYSLGFFKQILSHLTFLSYFVYKDAGFGINGAYWTLSIEMLWYIVAPLLFIFIKKDRYLVLLFMASILYLIGLDFSLYDSFLGMNKNDSNYMLLKFFLSFQLPGQLIYFITGILIYKYIQKPINIANKYKYLISFFILAFFIYISSQYNLLTIFSLNNIFILFCVSILFILLHNSYQPKIMQPIEWIGKISFSIYLWHMPILYILKHTSALDYLSLASVTAVFIIVLFIISSLSYYLIEEAGFSMRKRLEIRKKVNLY